MSYNSVCCHLKVGAFIDTSYSIHICIYTHETNFLPIPTTQRERERESVSSVVITVPGRIWFEDNDVVVGESLPPRWMLGEEGWSLPADAGEPESRHWTRVHVENSVSCGV